MSWGVLAVRSLLALALVLMQFVVLLPTSPRVFATECEFVLGFNSLHAMIPGAIGECVENERHNPANGDGLQRTSGGLLVWRKSDNWTAFTDGYRTWINGPNGLQARLNTERFQWEKDFATTAQPVECTSDPRSVLKSHDVDIVNFELFRTNVGTMAMNVRVRNNCEEARRIQFRARVDVDDSSPILSLGTTYEDYFGPNEERGYVYGWANPDGTYPPIEPSNRVTFRWNWVKVGSTEPQCVDVGASRCLSADPWARSTIEDLATVPEGAALLKTAAEFGVSIRRGWLPPGALAAYQPLTKVITYQTDLDADGEFERATVLAHELRHAVDHAENVLGDSPEECLQAEERAFRQQSLIWYKLWRDVLPRPQNPLQLRLNQMAEAVRNNPGLLSGRILEVYAESCE